MAGGGGHGEDGGDGGVPGMAAVIAELEKKITADPKDLTSYRQLGQALAEQGDWDRAAQVLLEAITLAPKDVALRVLRARVLIQRRDQGAALAELEAAKKIAPDDEDLLRAFGSYYILAEDMDQAVAVRKRLLAKHPDIPDAEAIEREVYYLAKFPKLREEGKLKAFFDAAGAAKVQANAGRWDEAIVTLQKVLALMPDDPEHWTDLGIAQRRAGRKEEGIASLRKALTFDRNHRPARVELARALSEDGDAKGAIAVLKEWRKIDAKRADRYDADVIIARLEKGEPFGGAPAAGAGGSTGTAAPAGSGIAGTVRLSPALASKVPRGASLFVIAKKSPTERMPLAVKRLAGASFPASFRLTQAESMAGLPLEGDVYLSARIEVDGQMGSGPGDLEGALASAVPADAGGVEIVIDREVGASGSGTAAAPPAPEPAPGGVTPASGGSSIRGTIQLDPALASKIPSGATLYIFAKANRGPGAPLAVIRRPVPAFPFDFELSDRDAMMPGVTLEGQVYLTARIDTDGDAGGGPGDLEGVTESPVPVGSADVALTIDTMR